MGRNDPERLEAEAKEMMAQMMNPEPEPEASDTQELEEEPAQEAPFEPEDTAELVAEAVPEEESESGEVDSEADQRIAKAEKAMKGAQAKMTKATQEAADLRKQVSSLIESVTELKGQLADSKRDNEKLQQVREDYPDVAGPLLDELDSVRARLDEQAALADQQQQALSQENERKAADAHFSRIAEAHPDYAEVTQTSDWALWLDEQGPDVHMWVEQGSSNDVIAVLNEFKASMGVQLPTPQEKALARAKEAAQPKMPKARKANVAGEKKTWTVQEIMDMPLDQFEKHQNEIMKAQAEGSIRR